MDKSPKSKIETKDKRIEDFYKALTIIVQKTFFDEIKNKTGDEFKGEIIIMFDPLPFNYPVASSGIMLYLLAPTREKFLEQLRKSLIEKLADFQEDVSHIKEIRHEFELNNKGEHVFKSSAYKLKEDIKKLVK